MKTPTAVIVTATMLIGGLATSPQPTARLQPRGYIELPAHQKPGGFDHADVLPATGRVWVAHTANDSVDIIDGANDRYLRSVPDLKGVAGALVAAEANLVFTSNRGEDTVGMFPPSDEAALTKVRVGTRPNGLAHDPTRNLLLVGHGDDDPGVIDVFDVDTMTLLQTVPTEKGANTIAFDAERNKVYAFLPQTHRAAVLVDRD